MSGGTKPDSGETMEEHQTKRSRRRIGALSPTRTRKAGLALEEQNEQRSEAWRELMGVQEDDVQALQAAFERVKQTHAVAEQQEDIAPTSMECQTCGS